MRAPAYRHTPDMGEISGFGDGYEACCQDMLEAGMLWLIGHGSANLEASAYKNVYGIINPETPECEELSNAVIAGAKGEATGAMHHAVLSRLLWISKHSWDEYCAELRKEPAS